MSPLFGHRDGDAQSGADPLQAEVERLGSLSLSDLAAEVMEKGFGVGGPGEDAAETVTVGGPSINAGPTAAAIAAEFVAGKSDELLRVRRDRLVAEGLQALEHASLVRAQLHTATGSLDYAITRLGRAAVSSGAVSRIVGGGSL